MIPAWKILAPVDLNRNADLTVQRALSLAGMVPGQLILLNVADRPTGSDDGPRPLRTGHRGLCSETEVRRAGPTCGIAPAICHYADFVHADLILMMSSGARYWPRFRGEPVTRQVLQATHRPVIIANTEGERAAYFCKRILCVLNLYGADEPLIDWVRRIAFHNGAEITLLHVLPEVSEALLYAGVAPGSRPLSRTVAIYRIREAGSRLMAPYSTMVAAGAPETLIAEAARQILPDLIVMERPSPGGRAPGVPDPLAMLRRVSCPILAVPLSGKIAGERRQCLVEGTDGART